MTTISDMLFQLDGVPTLNIPFSSSSKYYFVDPTSSAASDNNSGLSLDDPLSTIGAAFDKCTANQHDTVLYVAGSTSVSEDAAITWSKNYTHLIGIAAPTRVAQRARIFQTSTATGLSPLLNITGTGCIFKNFYIFQGVDDATSLINVQVTGGRNYFENVHFAGGGHATQAVNGGASLKLNGAEENTFVNCTIGVDTISAGTGMTAITLDGSSARNTFENCLIQLYISNAGAVLCELIDTTSVDRWNEFRNCTFFSNSTNKGTTMSSAFVIPSGHTTTATIFLRDCMGLGFTDWDADDRGILYLNTGTTTGGGNSGLAVVSAAT